MNVSIVPDLPVFAAPLIVREVVSPPTERVEFLDKLIEYNSVPSIQHHLIVQPEKRAVVHHSGMTKVTGLLRSGDDDIIPDQLGIKVAVADLIEPDDLETDW